MVKRLYFQRYVAICLVCCLVGCFPERKKGKVVSFCLAVAESFFTYVAKQPPVSCLLLVCLVSRKKGKVVSFFLAVAESFFTYVAKHLVCFPARKKVPCH